MNNVVGQLKSRYNSPYFLIGGDFNKRDIARELRVYNDLELERTPPTRGDNTLDLVITNFHQYITRTGVTDPIFNTQGTTTDHKTVYINAKIPRVPQYAVEKYSDVQQTPEGDTKLKEFLNTQDWEAIIKEGDKPDKMVETLHRTFEKGMAECYTTKTSSKKTSEPPWLTSGIRRLIRRRRASIQEVGKEQGLEDAKKEDAQVNQRTKVCI